MFTSTVICTIIIFNSTNSGTNQEDKFMSELRGNIIKLINSGTTAHKVAKETTVPRNTVYRIFSGEANLDNISLKNAELLSQYYLNNVSNEIKEQDLVFVYRYDEDSDELFAVMNETEEYELASISDLDREEEWGKFVVVKEGAFRWDYDQKDYIKI